ncbi:hypothetical protein HanIR_Chr11g0539181 [Helianthus annuus]|nr:hypothetical protein HanIR_Chr11g0539181 [Helianthus annuus]
MLGISQASLCQTGRSCIQGNNNWIRFSQTDWRRSTNTCKSLLQNHINSITHNQINHLTRRRNQIHRLTYRDIFYNPNSNYRFLNNRFIHDKRRLLKINLRLNNHRTLLWDNNINISIKQLSNTISDVNPCLIRFRIVSIFLYHSSKKRMNNRKNSGVN